MFHQFERFFEPCIGESWAQFQNFVEIFLELHLVPAVDQRLLINNIFTKMHAVAVFLLEENESICVWLELPTSQDEGADKILFNIYP